MPWDDAAVGEKLDELREQAPLVLSAASPLDSAGELVRRAYQLDGARTLHHQQGAFYLWSGVHYVEAPVENIRAAAYAFLNGAQCERDGKRVPFNPNRSKVANVLEALAALAQLPADVRPPTWLGGESRSRATEFLPCANGLLHLPTRDLTPPTPTFFGLNSVSYPFDADVPPPDQWTSFLHTIWPDDPTSIETIQELFGLLLTNDTSQQKCFLLVGPRRSGKGTIARVLTAMLGKESVVGPTLSSLQQNFGLMPLIGKPLAIISDARLSGRAHSSIVVERLLAISGEDAITVDRKNREAWTGRLPTRFVILTNELPRFTDVSGALASRCIILLFTRSFLGNEDTGLTERLLRELPGILNWSLAGYDRLMARGHFEQPASGDSPMRDLEDLASPISAFLRDRCLIGPGYGIQIDALFTGWVDWCHAQNREHVGTKQTFGRDLRAACPAVGVTQPRENNGDRDRYYDGLTLDPSKY